MTDNDFYNILNYNGYKINKKGEVYIQRIVAENLIPNNNVTKTQVNHKTTKGYN